MVFRRAWRKRVERALPAAVAAVIGVALVLGAGVGAFAQTASGDPFQRVQTFVCNGYQYLNGPLGLAIVVVMVVIGGIAMAVGSHRAMPMLIGAVVGAAIILGSTTMLRAMGVSVAC